jgi:large subunit ribosomal protein L17
MRHGKKNNHLGRTAPHRAAMLSNMASSLILHKRINTTVAKAKALRKYVEPLLNKSKDDSTNSRRVVFSYLQNKEAVTILFREIAEKIASRPGGYTRILKTGMRLGDNADMCFIELVDYNENMLKTKEPAKAKSTRRKKAGPAAKKASDAAAPAEVEKPVDAPKAAKVKEAPKAEAAPESPKAEAAEETPSADAAEKKPKAKKAKPDAEDAKEE